MSLQYTECRLAVSSMFTVLLIFSSKSDVTVTPAVTLGEIVAKCLRTNRRKWEAAILVCLPVGIGGDYSLD